MVNFKLIVLAGIVIAFISAGGLEISRKGISEARKLKDDFKEKTSDFRETSKNGGKNNNG